MLWKDTDIVLSNNYSMQLNRMKNTEKYPTVDQACSDTIESYVEKGYISKVHDNEQDAGPMWYLPHFPVIRLDNNVVRIVFDASARF